MRPWTPELQPERTALAWSRSSLAMLGACMLVAREAVATGVALVPAVAAVAAAGVAWVAIALLAPRRYRIRSRALAAARPHDVMVPAVVAASACALLCLAALAVAIASVP